MWNTPGFSTPGTSTSASFTFAARSSRVPRSGPKILTAFSPLTPDRASITLSRMFWEKSQSTPGNSRFRSAFMSTTSSALVRGRPYLAITGHCSAGLSGTNVSMFEYVVESVPSSGRPSCGQASSTSGYRDRTSATVRLRALASSNEIFTGKTPRIQRLPSSSSGMNSRPMVAAVIAVTAVAATNAAVTGQRIANSPLSCHR
jgi:hypothetical protein